MATLCKRLLPAPSRSGPALLMRFVVLTALCGCGASQAPRAISLTTLENAPIVPALAAERVVVTDTQTLQQLCTPLGSRLGLLQIRSPEQWRQLARVAPRLGPCPDLTRGMIVGLACWAGMPVDGCWPVRLDTIRMHDGAGLLNATFQPGSYLPDGSAYLETAYVEGLHAVLVVDVNGTSFYPD